MGTEKLEITAAKNRVIFSRDRVCLLDTYAQSLIRWIARYPAEFLNRSFLHCFEMRETGSLGGARYERHVLVSSSSPGPSPLQFLKPAVPINSLPH